jgi:hypothetical protein
MSEYFCVVCNVKLSSNDIHAHYLEELANKFSNEGFKIIQEGKIPSRICKTLTDIDQEKPWCAPDLFVLKNSVLIKVVEISVVDNYESGEHSIHTKCKKIRDYYNPSEIIVFEPINFLDKYHLPNTKNSFTSDLGHVPTSYTEIERHFCEKWKRNGLNVVFWNEDNL